MTNHRHTRGGRAGVSAERKVPLVVAMYGLLLAAAFLPWTGQR